MKIEQQHCGAFPRLKLNVNRFLLAVVPEAEEEQAAPRAHSAAEPGASPNEEDED